MEYTPGDVVVYTDKINDNGYKHVCNVIGVSSDGWVLDAEHGTCFSQSFHPDHVIVWEHRKNKTKK